MIENGFICSKLDNSKKMTIYTGLIHGSVYDTKGDLMKEAEWHFWDTDPDLFTVIGNIISEHVRKYMDRGCFQAGFGGDDLDGCIDYSWNKPAPDIPEMPFEINGQKYSMRFSASPNTIV